MQPSWPLVPAYFPAQSAPVSSSSLVFHSQKHPPNNKEPIACLPFWVSGPDIFCGPSFRVLLSMAHQELPRPQIYHDSWSRCITGWGQEYPLQDASLLLFHPEHNETVSNCLGIPTLGSCETRDSGRSSSIAPH